MANTAPAAAAPVAAPTAATTPTLPEGDGKCCCGHDASHWIWFGIKMPIFIAIFALSLLPFVIGLIGSIFAFPCRCEMMDCCQEHSDLPIIFGRWFRYPFWAWRWFYGRELTPDEKKVLPPHFTVLVCRFSVFLDLAT